MHLEAIYARLNMTADEIRQHPQLLINAFDRDWRVLIWNQQCIDYFGISEEQALGKKLTELLPGVEKSERMILLQKALSGQLIHVINDRLERTGGHYEQRVIPIRDKAHRVIAALNIVQLKNGQNKPDYYNPDKS